MSWTEDYGNEIFHNYNMGKLKRDECYVKVNNHHDGGLWIYSAFKECKTCPYVEKLKIPENTTAHIFKSQPEEFWRLMLTNEHKYSYKNIKQNVLCEVKPNLEEFGIYVLNIKEDGCSFHQFKEPVNIYMPIFMTIIIFGAIGLGVLLLNCIWKKHIEPKNKTEIPAVTITLPDEEQQVEKPQTKERIKALDTFRGISIVLMIFVNYGGGGYEFIEHAVWNGLHIADLVFPWFLWIMGVCMPISLLSQLKKNISRKFILQSIIRRSCILFLIGLFLNSGPLLKSMRFMGVLQRFGICYLIVGSVCAMFMKREQPEPKTPFQSALKDILFLSKEWTIMIAIFIVHCLIVFLLPVPGCPTGYLGPGGMDRNASFVDRNCIGGATGYVDRLFLGKHIFQNPTARYIFKSGAFDPEGLLGSLTSVIQVFFGVQAGMIIVQHGKGDRIKRFIWWSLFTGLIGGGLCGFSADGGVIPVNKNLWSISFVLITTSFAFVLLSFCYWVIDQKGYWTGKPFLFPGMNAIVMYVGHSLVTSQFPFHWLLEKNNTHFILLMQNVWATCCWIVVAYYLYKIKFFLSI